MPSGHARDFVVSLDPSEPKEEFVETPAKA